MPLHEVQTKDPIVVFTYVGPLCPQSKHFLLWGKAARSLRSFKFFSSCFFFTEAIMDVCSASLPRTAQVYEKNFRGGMKLEHLVTQSRHANLCVLQTGANYLSLKSQRSLWAQALPHILCRVADFIVEIQFVLQRLLKCSPKYWAHITFLISCGWLLEMMVPPEQLPCPTNA